MIMDYFVSANKSLANQWQLELLIESFNRHGITDNLLVSLVPSGDPEQFCKNLNRHKRVSHFNDIGYTRGYDRLNTIYGLIAATDLGQIKQPFMMVPLDCVLFSPPIVKASDRPKITVQSDPLFTFKLAEENIPNLSEYISEEAWLPVGRIMCFDQVPPDVFKQVVQVTELLAYHQLKAGRKIWPLTDRAAWASVLSGAAIYMALEFTYNWEIPFVAYGVENNFYSYERGISGMFSKSMFAFNPISFGHPFETLKTLPERFHTTGIYYLSELAGKIQS